MSFGEVVGRTGASKSCSPCWLRAILSTHTKQYLIADWLAWSGCCNDALTFGTWCSAFFNSAFLGAAWVLLTSPWKPSGTSAGPGHHHGRSSGKGMPPASSGWTLHHGRTMSVLPFV